MNVLAIVKDKATPGAVEIYRVTSPFHRVNAETRHNFGWLPKNYFYDALESNPGYSEQIDVFVFQRMLTFEDAKIKTMIEGLRAFGKTTVYECDDDYSGEYRVVGKHPDASWDAFIQNVDVVTTSTEGLAKRVKECAPHAETQVLPNYLPLDFWEARTKAAKRTDGPVRIMLSGSNTHYVDWLPLAEVIERIDAEYGYDVQWVIAGFRPEYLDGFDLHNSIEWVDPVPYEDYPLVLYSADIGVCPLNPNDKFNDSKSPIKALEYWAARRRLTAKHPNRKVHRGWGGAAVVATDHPVYWDVIDDGNNGLLAKHSAPSYYENIKLLLDDPTLRRAIQMGGLKEAQKYGINDHWHLWQDFYEMLLELKDTSPPTPPPMPEVEMKPVKRWTVSPYV